MYAFTAMFYLPSMSWNSNIRHMYSHCSPTCHFQMRNWQFFFSARFHLKTLNPKILINMTFILLKLGVCLSAPLCPDMSWIQAKVGHIMETVCKDCKMGSFYGEVNVFLQNSTLEFTIFSFFVPLSPFLKRKGNSEWVPFFNLLFYFLHIE